MAAGRSSRFGRLKQFEKIGIQNSYLLEFGIYDAIKAGFQKIIIIIRDNYKKYLMQLEKDLAEKIEIEIIIQKSDNLQIKNQNSRREKPWGTAHAIWCCKDSLKDPFVIINADDFYGYKSYKIIHENLTKEKKDCFLIGYNLRNTLSKNGKVNRGICSFNSDFYLQDIHEEIGITNCDNFKKDTIVSMNMWGFQLDFLNYLDKELELFLKENEESKSEEFFIPTVVNNAIKNHHYNFKILKTNERWFGMTYEEDIKIVEKEIILKNYPEELWRN